MDLNVVSRVAANAKTQHALDAAINAARRQAKPEQLAVLKDIERANKHRLAVTRREGNPDFEGRLAEALRVLEAFLSIKNGRTQPAGRTRQSIQKNGPVEALRRIIAKRDSPGLRTLAEHDRLDCAFEQIALDFPEMFDADTLTIAKETLARERNLRA